MQTLFPHAIDLLGSHLTPNQRNSRVANRNRITMQTLAAEIVALQRQAGHFGSTDTTSTQARLAAIEALLGLTPPVQALAEAERLVYPDQVQAGFVASILVPGTTITFAHAFAADADVLGDYAVELRCYEGFSSSVEASAARTPTGLTIAVAQDCSLEWRCKGKLYSPCTPLEQEGTVPNAQTNGTLVTYPTAYTAALDAVRGDYVLTELYGINASGIYVEVGADRTPTGVTVFPAEVCTVYWRTTGRTQ